MSFRRFFGLAGATVLAAGLSSSASAQSIQAPGKGIPAPRLRARSAGPGSRPGPAGPHEELPGPGSRPAGSDQELPGSRPGPAGPHEELPGPGSRPAGSDQELPGSRPGPAGPRQGRPAGLISRSYTVRSHESSVDLSTGDFFAPVGTTARWDGGKTRRQSGLSCRETSADYGGFAGWSRYDGNGCPWRHAPDFVRLSDLRGRRRGAWAVESTAVVSAYHPTRQRRPTCPSGPRRRRRPPARRGLGLGPDRALPVRRIPDHLGGRDAPRGGKIPVLNLQVTFIVPLPPRNQGAEARHDDLCRKS